MRNVPNGTREVKSYNLPAIIGLIGRCDVRHIPVTALSTFQSATIAHRETAPSHRFSSPQNFSHRAPPSALTLPFVRRFGPAIPVCSIYRLSAKSITEILATSPSSSRKKIPTAVSGNGDWGGPHLVSRWSAACDSRSIQTPLHAMPMPTLRAPPPPAPTGRKAAAENWPCTASRRQRPPAPRPVAHRRSAGSPTHSPPGW